LAEAPKDDTSTGQCVGNSFFSAIDFPYRNSSCPPNRSSTIISIAAWCWFWFKVGKLPSCLSVRLVQLRAFSAARELGVKLH
jgi:hypothetical protein